MSCGIEQKTGNTEKLDCPLHKFKLNAINFQEKLLLFWILLLQNQTEQVYFPMLPMSDVLYTLKIHSSRLEYVYVKKLESLIKRSLN